MSSLASVRDLIAKADQASREASEKVRPAHSEALSAARALRDKLYHSIQDPARKERLLAIIIAGTEQRNLAPSKAATVLIQYTENVLKSSSMTSTDRMDGGILMNSIIRRSYDWPEERRQMLIDTMVLSFLGKVDTGLIKFAGSLTDSVSIDDATEMARVSNPEGFQEYRKEIAELVSEYNQACKMMQAIEKATPSLFITKTGENIQVEIVSRRRGPVTFSMGQGRSITIGPDEPVKVSFEDFGDLSNDQFFKCYRDCGDMEVVSMDSMVEPI